MSDLINKISYLNETKELMRTKLGLASNVPFRSYVNIIITGSSEEDLTHARPSDWLTLPVLIAGEDFDFYLRVIKKGKIINIRGGVVSVELLGGMREASLINKFYWKIFSKNYGLPVSTEIPELKEMWESIS